MKKIVYYLVALTVSIFALNPNLEAYSCRQSLDLHETMPFAVDAVERDLTSGIWSAEGTYLFSNNSKNIVFEFQGAGVLDVYITDLEDKTSYETNFWHLSQYGEEVFLVLEDEINDKDHLFGVEQTCEGITLVDYAGGETIYLTYMPKADDVDMFFHRANIIGNWVSNEYPFEIAEDLEDCGTFEEMEGAQITYQFNQDATFTRTIGGEGMQIIETGIWDLNADGRFITLYLSDEENLENVRQVNVMSIESLSNASMQVLHELENSSFESFFCTSTKHLSFRKIDRS